MPWRPPRRRPLATPSLRICKPASAASGDTATTTPCLATTTPLVAVSSNAWAGGTQSARSNETEDCRRTTDEGCRAWLLSRFLLAFHDGVEHPYPLPELFALGNEFADGARVLVTILAARDQRTNNVEGDVEVVRSFHFATRQFFSLQARRRRKKTVPG